MTRYFRFTLAFLLVLVPTAVMAQSTPAPAPQPPAQPPPSSPLTIRIGDAEILPGGFIEALAIGRSTYVGSGPPTALATASSTSPVARVLKTGSIAGWSSERTPARAGTSSQPSRA